MPRNSPTFTMLLVLVCVMVSCRSSGVITVSVLLQQRENFNHMEVTVAGCYVKAFEKTVLGPCSGQTSPDNSIWVDSAEYALATAPVAASTASKPTLPVPALSEQQRATYLRLLKQPPGSTSVVVQGEFQTTTSGGFGPGYRNRLILHRVLEIKADR